jgi:hypothetical protein
MTGWPPAGPGYLIVRPGKGKGGRARTSFAIGAGDVAVQDERGRRAYLRPGGVPGELPISPGGPVVALRGRYGLTERPGVERIDAVELVGERGAAVDGVAWSGSDAAALEHAAASTGMPLEWAPAGPLAPAQPVPPRQDVRLRRPLRRGREVTAEYDPAMTLVLGRREVSVLDAAGRPRTWPRIGFAPPEVPAVARMRIHHHFPESFRSSLLMTRSSTVHVWHVALLGLDGQVCCLLPWAGEQRDVLWQAAFSVGLLVEHSAANAGEHQLARRGVPVI